MMNKIAFEVADNPANRILQFGGKPYLYFGGTAYLGLSIHPEFQELHVQGIKKYGINIGTSRINNVQLKLYRDAEEKLAERFAFTDALLTSSGYLASQLLYQYYSQEADKIFTAPNTHPANSPGVKLNYPELRREDWEKNTLREIHNSNKNTFLILSNSLDNLYPQKYSFEWIDGVDENKKVILIIDDSHGLGIVCENKSSVSYENIKKNNIEVLITASLAKGFNTDAGLILGEKESLNKLRKHPVFVGASPPSPAAVFAMRESENLYKRQRQILLENIKTFRKLVNNSLISTEKFPVFTFPKESFYTSLLQRGFLISSFPYPNHDSKDLDRIVLSACHKHEDLEKLNEALQFVSLKK